ncbi:MAG: LuxR C-terminal-related transcriptional regulator [Actinomycetes bacterium]
MAEGALLGTTSSGSPRRPPWGRDLGVIAAKLARPEIPPGYVARPRLVAAVAAGTHQPVTLVSAGPGWGKTLLVSSWVAAAAPSNAVAWLTLDADDNEPRVFWTYVIAALRSSGVVDPGNPLASVAPAAGLTNDVQQQIRLGISQLARPVVLVLDDLHEVDNDAVLEQLASLLRHESPLRLVLLTRVDPALPLHRLRVSGGLAEIRVDDLAFDTAEAAALLSRQGLPLDHGDLHLLLDRTDGWAAGLRLAAMFLSRPGARLSDFGGADRAVADYLLGEVVADQSPQTWQFLLRTSVVPRVCGELADALTGQGHGQLQLDQLERDNAFVSALGPERRWYRYHPLLTDMLRRQLELERPETARDLHERAAHWFAANGQPIDAVRQAAAARSWPLVGTLLAQVAAHRLLTADRHALTAVLAQIPTAELAATPELQLCAAALCLVEGRITDIEPHLVLARSMLADSGAAGDPSTHIVLDLLEAAIGRARGSAPTVVQATTRALGRLEEAGSAVPLAREFRAVALGNKGVGLLWQDEIPQAERCLTAGLEATEALGVEVAQVNALGHLGLAAAVGGRLYDATDLASRGRTLAEARGWTSLTQAAPSFLSLAIVCLQRNELDQAEHLLSLAGAAQQTEPEILTLLAQHLVHAVVDVSRGRLTAAEQRVRDVRTSLAGRQPPALLARWLVLAAAEVELAAGHPEAVRSRLETGDPGADASALTDEERLALAKARLAMSEPLGLDALLGPVVAQRHDLRMSVDASVVQALAADRLRLDHQALEAVRRAVAEAQPQGLLHPFTTTDPARMRDLLERVVLLRPAQAAFARTLLDAQARAVPGPRSAQPPLEAVTERERTVLQYLATMLSNAEIAERMFISPNTIKVHLRHLYQKLEVTSRRAAVQRARELHLLGDEPGSEAAPARDAWVSGSAGGVPAAPPATPR